MKINRKRDVSFLFFTLIIVIFLKKDDIFPGTVLPAVTQD